MTEHKSVKIRRKPGSDNLINANNIFEPAPKDNVNNNEWKQSGMLQDITLEKIRNLIHKNNLWGQSATSILNTIGDQKPLNSIKAELQKIDKIKKVLHFYKQWNNIRKEEYGPINKLETKRAHVKTMHKSYRTNNQIKTSQSRTRCEDHAKKTFNNTIKNCRKKIKSTPTTKNSQSKVYVNRSTTKKRSQSNNNNNNNNSLNNSSSTRNSPKSNNNNVNSWIHYVAQNMRG